MVSGSQPETIAKITHHLCQFHAVPVNFMFQHRRISPAATVFDLASAS